MVADADTEEVLGFAMVGHTAGDVVHAFPRENR
jgi:pyruvate/2-oxoglutarate dehydrogenase complex dihydrolipoamide dehydrogenase (E3) component